MSSNRNTHMPRAPWTAPMLRRICAREARMPVGKATPGGDGISQS